MGCRFREKEQASASHLGVLARSTGQRSVLLASRHWVVGRLLEGSTLCGHFAQGCFLPRHSPIYLKSKRATSVIYMPMALTADLWSRGGKGVTLITDAFAVRVNTDSPSVARSVTDRID